jgi:hypothetical protein
MNKNDINDIKNIINELTHEFIQIGNYRQSIYYAYHNDKKKTLIIVHGANNDSKSIYFELRLRFGEKLLENYNLILFDLPSHGMSSGYFHSSINQKFMFLMFTLMNRFIQYEFFKEHEITIYTTSFGSCCLLNYIDLIQNTDKITFIFITPALYMKKINYITYQMISLLCKTPFRYIIYREPCCLHTNKFEEISKFSYYNNKHIKNHTFDYLNHIHKMMLNIDGNFDVPYKDCIVIITENDDAVDNKKTYQYFPNELIYNIYSLSHNVIADENSDLEILENFLFSQ